MFMNSKKLSNLQNVNWLGKIFVIFKTFQIKKILMNSEKFHEIRKCSWIQKTYSRILELFCEFQESSWIQKLFENKNVSKPKNKNKKIRKKTTWKNTEERTEESLHNSLSSLNLKTKKESTDLLYWNKRYISF